MSRDEDEGFYFECPYCCYAVSGSNEYRLDLKMDAHVRTEHEEETRRNNG